MLIAHSNMICFLFYSPQKSLFSEFGSHEFKFLKALSPCAISISKGQLYLMEFCILRFLLPLQFVLLAQKRSLMLISLLNMIYFVFYSPQMCLFSVFASREFKFLKAQSPFAISISKGQLYLMEFCILRFLVPLQFILIGQKCGFNSNTTFLYDFFVFYSPEMSLFSEFGSCQFKF